MFVGSLFGSFEVRRDRRHRGKLQKYRCGHSRPLKISSSSSSPSHFRPALENCILSSSFRNHIHFFITSLRIQGTISSGNEVQLRLSKSLRYRLQTGKCCLYARWELCVESGGKQGVCVWLGEVSSHGFAIWSSADLLSSNKSRTLPFENRKNIASIALSPDGNVLISIDEGEYSYH